MAQNGIGYMSASGINFLLSEEGWTGIKGGNYKSSVVCKQQAIDRSDVITVGPGMTNLAYPNIVKAGKTVTFEEICWMFKDFIKNVSKEIDKKCPQIKSFGQPCVDAVISFAYNAGTGKISNFRNAKSATDVANIIAKGPKSANGKILPGLVARREAEVNIVNGVKSGKSSTYFSQFTQKTIDVIKSCGGDPTYIPNDYVTTDTSTSTNLYSSNTSSTSSNGGTNDVTNLAMYSRRQKTVLQQSEGRKTEFDALRNKMVSDTPELGRDILLTEELYDTNILKGTQESKRDNA